MSDGWKISGAVSRERASAAPDRQAEDEGWDPDIVLPPPENAEPRPEEGMVDAGLPRPPHSNIDSPGFFLGFLLYVAATTTHCPPPGMRRYFFCEKRDNPKLHGHRKLNG